MTAGIGTTIGTTIPDEQSPSGLYRDRRGQHVVSKLNPESLQYLARQTEGQYVQLSDGAALNRFVKDIADRLDTTEGKEEVRRVPNDRYIIFAVPALICLLLTLLAGTRWRSFRRSRTPRYDISDCCGVILRRTAGPGSAGGHARPGPMSRI